MDKKCKPKSTWQMYSNVFRFFARTRPRVWFPPRFAGAIAGFLWFFIGFWLVIGQFNLVEKEGPFFIFPFPFNLLIGIVAGLVILPLGIIHLFKIMNESLETDC